ncbi:MAG: aminotransferase class I/II-fold pyridoxal phosphate-dependent enzyme [Oscillospiraceae bacterium]
MKLDHNRAPLYEAMKEYQLNRVVKFDVPGHKGGRGNKVLSGFLGEGCMKNDVNSMKPLDNLCHPVSVIKEAQEYAADAFGAENSIFIVNGATGAVQAMVMSVCKAGDKIILPRNVHRSAINALVVCGAVPVYVNPGVNSSLGIPLGMTPEEVEAAILLNPDAKAVLVNNPTYYGICSDLRRITQIAHSHGLKVLCDEAHGTHFYFGENLPPSGMSCGADMAAVSVHKTGGSLTQSALLLLGKGVDPNYVRQIINLTQTTSASYLLMASLDLARQNLALNGKEFYAKTVEFADYARQEINAIGGYYAFGAELCNGRDFFAFDSTKLSIHTRAMGLAGIEVYDLLRDEYGIQIEFGDIGNILAIITGGDRSLEIERLLGALSEIKRIYAKSPVGLYDHEYIDPILEMTPQGAFYAEQETLPIEAAAGRICSEFVMCYPPGIPILAPGERITKDILDYIAFAKEKGCSLTGCRDMNVEYLQVVK